VQIYKIKYICHVKRFFFIFLSLFLSCNAVDNYFSNSTPLSKEDFRNCLKEFYLSESYNLQNVVDSSSSPYQQILLKYNVNYEEFIHSFDYYSTNPKLMLEIYDSILEDLENEKNILLSL
tara:strand:- start:351 stop:710 length:360 start_codon:yes stop_codon:yes gene_type:complete